MAPESERYHLRGTLLPAGEPGQLWVADGVVRHEPVPGARTLSDGGWISPGLVDAHCHVGIGTTGPVAMEAAITQARAERDAGALLLRDAGSPVDTRSLDARPDLPRIIRAGRHVALTRRYIPGVGIELDDESGLVAAVREQARRGDGWVKLVGDWIDRSTGDLAPLWSDAVLVEAIAAAHEEGARVTAHVFGSDALPGLVRAGIDCLEHGTGLTEDSLALLVEHGTALVPTLINIETFPSIADGAGRYPVYAAHMRDLHARVGATIGAAVDAGIPVYAGTDAGGGITHGRIADEVAALVGVGMSAHDALGAACWDARAWLGDPGPVEGASADLLVHATDPRTGPDVLRTPEHVLLRGVRVGGRG